MKKSVFHLLGSNIISKLIGIGFSVYIGKFYGSSFLGSYILFLSILSFTAFISKLGLIFALEKRISEVRKDENELISTALWINISLLLLTVGFILLLRNHISDYVMQDNNVSLWLVACLLATNLNNFTAGIIRAKKKMNIYSNMIIIKEVIPKFLSFIGLIVVPTFSMLLVSVFIAEILAFIYSVPHLRSIRLTKPMKHSFNALFTLTKYNAMLEIRALAFNWFDVWMIGFFLSPSHVGIYQVTWQISSGILIFNKALTTVYFPYFSEWYANNKVDTLIDFLKKNLYLFVLFPIPVFTGSILLSEDILKLFGQEFFLGSNALIILFFCTIFRAFNELQSKVLVAIDRSKDSFVASSVSGIVNIVLNYILVQYQGINGAAVATTIGTVTNCIICSYYLNKKLGKVFEYKMILYNLLSSFIMLVFIYIFKIYINIENMAMLISLGFFIWLAVIMLNSDYSNKIKTMMGIKGNL